MLERERERRMSVDVGWERRKELGRGPENGIDRRKWARNPIKIGRKWLSFHRAALPTIMGGTAALPILQGLR